jgi:hypothetical protein
MKGLFGGPAAALSCDTIRIGSSVTMVRRIGFFHFGINHKYPFEELHVAMDQSGTLKDTLIVLPEAFNIGKMYGEKGFCNCDRRALLELQDLSTHFGVGIVAGLVINELPNTRPPHSSAF